MYIIIEVVIYMEYLDIYDEDGTPLGKEKRSVVHQNALWHKTVHCWLYDNEGNVYFQIRKEENKLYTTASGHIKAGETVKEAFGREVAEELGININYNQAILVNIYKFIMDKVKKDGSIFRDRAFSNVYVCCFEGENSKFNFDDDELEGLVKVNARETLELLKQEKGFINGIRIQKDFSKNIVENIKVDFNYFLVNKGETAIEKYGDVLNKIIELTSNNICKP